MCRGNLFILWRTILISPRPSSLPVRCLHKFFTGEAEKRQVLSSPRRSVAKYWFEYGAVEPAATDLCLSKAVRGRVIGQIWPKYGAGRWSIHFHARTRTRKKPLFNQALPLLWEGEQTSSCSWMRRKRNVG